MSDPELSSPRPLTATLGVTQRESDMKFGSGFFGSPLAGFLIAPLAPAVIHAVIYSSPFGIVIAGLGFAYPSAALLGLPTYFIFKRFSWLKVWQVVSAGFALGVLALMAYCTAVGAHIGLDKSFLSSAALYGAYGAVAGLVFWAIALDDVTFLSHI